MTEEITPEKLYQSGLDAFRSQQFKQGVQLLLEAAKQKHTPAIKELGICFLHGIGIRRSLPKAIQYFKISKNDVESQFELCKLSFFGHGMDENKDLARKLLISAALRKHPQALNLMAMCYQIQGDKEKADALFTHSLKSNHPFALHLKRTGLLKETRSDVDFIKSFQWQAESAGTDKKIFNQEPQVFEVKQLLSDYECEYIKYAASPFMRESMTVDPNTGQFIKDDIRTSHSASIDWMVEDPAINLIMKKCCSQFNIDASHSEVLHVLHYSHGEEYKPHYDFFGGVAGHENFDQSQQRIKTICLYLNDVNQGGETSFPRLNLEVKPEKGKAVFFENADKDTLKPYVDSLHAGKPVISGEKWLATLWIHNQPMNRGPEYVSIPS